MQANFAKINSTIIDAMLNRTIRHATKLKTLEAVRDRVIRPVLSKSVSVSPEIFDKVRELDAMLFEDGESFPRDGELVAEGEDIQGLIFPAGSRVWYENCDRLKGVKLSTDWEYDGAVFPGGALINFHYPESDYSNQWISFTAELGLAKEREIQGIWCLEGGNVAISQNGVLTGARLARDQVIDGIQFYRGETVSFNPWNGSVEEAVLHDHGLQPLEELRRLRAADLAAARSENDEVSELVNEIVNAYVLIKPARTLFSASRYAEAHLLLRESLESIEDVVSAILALDGSRRETLLPRLEYAIPSSFTLLQSFYGNIESMFIEGEENRAPAQTLLELTGIEHRAGSVLLIVENLGLILRMKTELDV